MIDQVEDAVPFSVASHRYFPPARSGRPVHYSVIGRWSDVGVIGPNGDRVRLKSWRVGGQRMTSQAAVEEFLHQLNPDSQVIEASSTAIEIDDAGDSARRGREACTALAGMGY